MDMIVCEEARFNYCTAAGEVEVLRGVNISIAQGTHVSIVGPSGAGKSTFLRLCAALDWPTQGNIRVGECRSTYDLSGVALARFRREQVGLVFQQFSLLPSLTALENVMLPLLPYTGRHLLRKRAASLLAEVGLASRAAHYPDQLAGGEQQRVAIARSLLASPPLLLADEPTGSLDSATGLRIMSLLDALRREHGCTLVVVTHDVNMAALADRQLHMVDGCIKDV